MGAVMLGGWAALGLGIYPNEHLHVNAFGLYLVATSIALALRMNVECVACETEVPHACPVDASEGSTPALPARDRRHPVGATR
jgi:hypothetical protein